jgi:hypothetical protein
MTDDETITAALAAGWEVVDDETGVHWFPHPPHPVGAWFMPEDRWAAMSWARDTLARSGFKP